MDPPEVFAYTKWGRDVRNFYIFRCYGFKGPDGEMDSRGEVRDYVDTMNASSRSAGRSLVRLP